MQFICPNTTRVTEIIYTAATPEEAEGPFLKEERNLINNIVEIIQVYFNKKRSQDSLMASEERFRSAFEHAAIGMGLVSLDGKWLKVNKELCHMVGYSKEELLSRTFQEITHPDDLGKDLELMNSTLSGKIDYFRLEKRYIHKYGSVVWINLNVSLVRDNNSKPIYFVSQIENITERIESQRKFQDLVEKSVVGIYILQDGKFAYVNPRLAEKSGYSQAELLAMPIEQYIHKDDWQTAQKNIQERLSGKVDEIRYQARAYTKTGQLLWLELFGAKTIYLGAPAIIGTMVNITEKKNLELEREKMLADLLQRNKDLDEFAQIVSHNLRGPLASILGLCDMLQDNKSDGQEKDFVLEGIDNSAKKLDAVVRELNNILHVKRSFDEEKTIVSLHDIVREIKAKFTNLLSSTSAEITCDFSDISEIFTIRSFLNDILYNLVSNSLHYRDKSRVPEISIQAKKTANAVLITVADNGIGIDLEKHGDKIFGLNKRFHNTDKGKGLGLYMVKAQVDVLNGKIDLISKPGVGTTVNIFLAQ